MERNSLDTPFERYADDAIVNCRNEEEAKLTLPKHQEGLVDVVWNFILIRPKYFIAKRGRKNIQQLSSIYWDIPLMEYE